MENNPTIDNPAATDEKEMKFNADDKRYLLSTAKWTEFLCIVMFVGIGLALTVCLVFMLVICFSSDFANLYEAGLPSKAMLPLTITYTVLFLIYLIPTLYMWRFARKARSAIASGNESEMTLSLKNLRAATKFYGIMVIVSIALMFLMVIVLTVMGIAGTI